MVEETVNDHLGKTVSWDIIRKYTKVFRLKILIYTPFIAQFCKHLLISNLIIKEWQSLIFAYAKTKTQISCAVTAQLISAFVSATRTLVFDLDYPYVNS